jgi:hypothetical protein
MRPGRLLRRKQRGFVKARNIHITMKIVANFAVDAGQLANIGIFSGFDDPKLTQRDAAGPPLRSTARIASNATSYQRTNSPCSST